MLQARETGQREHKSTPPREGIAAASRLFLRLADVRCRLATHVVADCASHAASAFDAGRHVWFKVHYTRL